MSTVVMAALPNNLLSSNYPSAVYRIKITLSCFLRNAVARPPSRFAGGGPQFHGVIGIGLGASMLTGFGGETLRAIKQVTFNTASPIAIANRNGFSRMAARSRRSANRAPDW
jgi:hypothetical protein